MSCEGFYDRGEDDDELYVIQIPLVFVVCSEKDDALHCAERQFASGVRFALGVGSFQITSFGVGNLAKFSRKFAAIF